MVYGEDSRERENTRILLSSFLLNKVKLFSAAAETRNQEAAEV